MEQMEARTCCRQANAPAYPWEHQTRLDLASTLLQSRRSLAATVSCQRLTASLPCLHCASFKLVAPLAPPRPPLWHHTFFIPWQIGWMLPKLLINFWNGKFCAKYNFSISVEIFVLFSALLWFLGRIPCSWSASGYIIGTGLHVKAEIAVKAWRINLK